MVKLYNIQHLINVNVKLNTTSQDIWYLKTWKTGWPWNRKRINGVKTTCGCLYHNYNSVDEFLLKHSNYCIINNIIYIKPHICMNFTDNIHKDIYFNTTEEATLYYQNLCERLKPNIIE